MVVRLQNATPLVLQYAPSNHLLINEKNKLNRFLFILRILLYGQAFYKNPAVMYGW